MTGSPLAGAARRREITRRGLSRFGMARRAIAALALVAAAAALCAEPAGAVTRVVASTTDLASIAARVGGDQVEVLSIAKATADPHRVEVLPSYMVRVSKAQLYLKVGLGLDQWADQIIGGSRNAHLAVLDCSRNIEALEKPTGAVNASMGDVHPNGNPHYWLDPRNGAVVARDVSAALGALDPAHARLFEANAQAFASEVDSTMSRGRRVAATLASREIITYHRSWPYLASAFGLDVAGTIEPVPGIPPTGRHLQDLVALIGAKGVKVVLQEPYFSGDAGDFLARQTGVHIARISPSSAGGKPGDYLAHFDEIFHQLAAAAAE